jgi:hypothetical protein
MGRAAYRFVTCLLPGPSSYHQGIPAYIKEHRLSRLTQEELKLFDDIMDMHIEGVLQSKRLTTEDTTVRSAEELLDLMSGYDDDMNMIASIREKVHHG